MKTRRDHTSVETKSKLRFTKKGVPIFHSADSKTLPPPPVHTFDDEKSAIIDFRDSEALAAEAQEKDRERTERHLSQSIESFLRVFTHNFSREFVKSAITPRIEALVTTELKSAPRRTAVLRHISDAPEMYAESFTARIASSQTIIGSDKNECTAYVIIAAVACPFRSTYSVSVKRFVELRKFAQEIRRLFPEIVTNSRHKRANPGFEFPLAMRCFAAIDESLLAERKQLINSYLARICEESLITNHSLFLRFFHLTDEDSAIASESLPTGVDCNGRMRTTSVSGHKMLTESDSRVTDNALSLCVERTLRRLANGDFHSGAVVDSESSAYLPEHFQYPSDLSLYKDASAKLMCAGFDMIATEIAAESSSPSRLSLGKTDIGIVKLPPKRGSPQRRSKRRESFRDYLPKTAGIAESALPAFSETSASESRAICRSTELTQTKASPKKLHLRSSSILASAFSRFEIVGTVDGDEEGDDRKEGGSGVRLQRGIGGVNLGLSTHIQKKTTQETGPRILREAAEAKSSKSLCYVMASLVREHWSAALRGLGKRRGAVDTLCANLQELGFPLVHSVVRAVVPEIKWHFATESLKKSHSLETGAGLSRMRSGTCVVHDSDDSDEKDEHYSDESSSDDYYERKLGVEHFAFLKAMREYCLLESDVFDYFLAFEKLAVRVPFAPLPMAGGRLASSRRPKRCSSKRLASDSFFSSFESHTGARYLYIHLLEYNFKPVLAHCSEALAAKMQGGSGVLQWHTLVQRTLCEFCHLYLCTFTRSFGLFVTHRDAMERRSFGGGTLSAAWVHNEWHECALIAAVRHCASNMASLASELKQRTVLRLGQLHRCVYAPLLRLADCLALVGANCLALVGSNFAFDADIPSNAMQFRRHFVSAWHSAVEHWLTDVTEAVFDALFESTVAMFCTAIRPLLESTLTSVILPKSERMQVRTSALTQRGARNLIPEELRGDVTVKELCQVAIDESLKCVVGEKLVFLRMEAEKRFYSAFAVADDTV